MILFALWLAVQTPDPTTAAKQSFEAGRLQYDLGHFAEALALFETAYAAKPLPGFLFNIGQCHFQLGHHEQAIYFYERYLEALPRAKNADVVRDLLGEARAKLADEKAAAAARAERETVAVAPPPPPPAASDATAANSAASSSSAAPPTGAGVDDEGAPWLWIGAGIGGAVVVASAIAVGVVLSQPPPVDASLGVLDRRTP